MTNFIIKKLAEELECLEDNTEKYIIFSIKIKNELENDKTIRWKIKFIDSCRFMSSSLSNIADNFSELLYSDKCTGSKPCLEYIATKDY